MTLGVTYDSLRREIGRYLGFSRNPNDWATNETADVEDVLSSGLRLFYTPPRLPGERSAHQWSFLRPLLTINTISGVSEYSLPDDFAGLDGSLTYSDSTAYGKVQLTSESLIRRHQQRGDSSGAPTYCAILPRIADGQSDQTFLLILWRTPDAAYVLRGRYYARQEMLSSANPYPMGGPAHAETIRAACMAAAEITLDDERGQKYQHFLDLLSASIDFDRRAMSPDNLGYNAARETPDLTGFQRTTAITQYVKYPVTEPEEPGEGEPEEVPDDAWLFEDLDYYQFEDGDYYVFEDAA